MWFKNLVVYRLPTDNIDFAVMAAELVRLLEDLGEALGGQPQRQAAAA